MMRNVILNAALSGVAALLTFASCARPAAAIDILVYDDSSQHQLAVTAAANLDPTSVVANAVFFNTLLVSQPWDVVLIDCPSPEPVGGWQPTVDFIGSGGRVAMSFWNWDNPSGISQSELAAAFGSSGTTASFSLNGRTLSDDGTTSVFSGVTMPNSNWHNHWVDDGDGFGFTVASGTVGMAHLTGIADPVMILGNNGRTIATFVIDETGTTWLNDGSGVRLWENMVHFLHPVPEPSCFCLMAIGVVVLLARSRRGNK